MNIKIRTILGWVLTVLISAVLFYSASIKLSGNPEVTANAAHFGLSLKKFMFLGIVEIISTILFIIPRTGVLGALLLAAYMGGALTTHLEHYLSPRVPVIIECVIFITAVIRFPELLTRITGKKPVALK